ncbi:MAG: hypothetical protein UT09_C0037G0001, partial [Parcubacteria group bacterium GW2011_GWF2_38_8]
MARREVVRKKVFGVDLEEIGEGVENLFVFEFMNYVILNPKQGIFREAGDCKEMLLLKKRLDSGERIIPSSTYIHNLTNLIKVYLRELPTPLIPQSSYDSLCSLLSDSEDREDLPKKFGEFFLAEYGTERLYFLKEIIGAMARLIEHADVTKMNISNLSLVFSPNLVRLDGKATLNSLVNSRANEI